MLLCKQPGDTGVFATAVNGGIRIYRLPETSQFLPGVKAAGSAGFAEGPLLPSCVIFEGDMHHRGVLEFAHAGASGLPRLHMTQLRPGICGGGANGGDVPLSLSLSCAQNKDTLQLFFSSTNLGAWIVSGSAISTVHHTLCSADAACREDFGHVADSEVRIMASGWNPLSHAELAIGGDDGVVQLLNVESGSGPTAAAARTMNFAVVDQNTATCSSSASFNRTLREDDSYSALGAHTTLFPTSSVVRVVQEHKLIGPVTSMDWVPRSKTAVVAAKRPDAAGCHVEVIDFRSGNTGVSYLGAPMGTITSTSQHLPTSAGSSSLVSCYADIVSCDYSQTYVATVGTQSGKGIVQLWDMRNSSRYVCSQPCSRTGYTSLCWTTSDISTVIGTTLNGDLCVHTFFDTRSLNAEDAGLSSVVGEEEANRLFLPLVSTHTTNIWTTAEVKLTGFSSSLPSLELRRNTKSLGETRCLQSSVGAVAAVAWLADSRLLPSCLDDNKKIARESSLADLKEGGCGDSRDAPLRVGSGRYVDSSCIILLKHDTGELYRRVFCPQNCALAVAGEALLYGAGPNIYILPDMGLYSRCSESLCGEENDTLSARNNNIENEVFFGNLDAASDNSGFDSSGGEAYYEVGQRSSTLQISGANAGESNNGCYSSTFKGTTGGITSLERTFRRLQRLRAMFCVESQKVLSVLLEEGCDHEAYVLFRYAWYVQRYLHPDKAVLLASDEIPGLIELLERERVGRVGGDSGTSLFTNVKHGAKFGIREFILRAVGWLIDLQEEKLMLVPPTGGFAVKCLEFPSSAVSGVRRLPISGAQQRLLDRLSADFPTIWQPLNEHGIVDAVSQPFSRSSFVDLTPFAVALRTCDHVAAESEQKALERRVAILVCMGQLTEASLLLTRNSDLNPFYSLLALALLGAAKDASFFSTLIPAVPATCSFWVNICLNFAMEFLPPASFVSDAGLSQQYWSSNVKGTGGLYQFSLKQRRKRLATFLRRFPFLSLPDVIGFSTLFILEPYPFANVKECQYSALIRVLRKLTEKQFDYNLRSGSSLLLAAAVEGLGGRDLTSLQRYVDETGDLQTPVVYVALYGQTAGSSWHFWNNAYCSQLNADGHFILRCFHDTSCVKMAQLREESCDVENVSNHKDLPSSRSPATQYGKVGMQPLLNAGLIDTQFAIYANSGGGGGYNAVANATTRSRPTDERDVKLRCKCGRSIKSQQQLPTGSQTTLSCGPNCPAVMCTVCGRQMFGPADGSCVETSFAWCTVCLHGGHWGHLRDWFTKYRTCSAEGCLCRCYDFSTQN